LPTIPFRVGLFVIALVPAGQAQTQTGMIVFGGNKLDRTEILKVNIRDEWKVVSNDFRHLTNEKFQTILKP